MGLFSSEISTKELVPVCRQLATSYEAGIPIVRTLGMVGEGARVPAVRDALTSMRDRVQEGATLGDAARAQRGRLPGFFVELLASGERGGKLDIMLRDLADYYEDRLAMQRQIVGSMVYPVIQLCMAWFLGTFALGLIQSIDFVSGTPFNFSRYLRGYAAFQGTVLLGTAGAFAGLVLLGRAGLIRWLVSGVSTRLWPFSTVTQKFALARFFRSMSLLIGAGMDIRSCIHNSAAVLMNPFIERDLVQAVPHVAKGATLTQAFSASRTLTPLAREMLSVGEHSGNLEGALRKVSEIHLAEAKHAVQVATRVMNLALALAVGATVGYIVITFYSRYFGQLNSVLDSI